jgi:DNA (cytosine-5)-methyltransferase 1
MSWESRRGRGKSYTRSTRKDGRIERLYLGRGTAAELAAVQDVRRRVESRIEEIREYARLQGVPDFPVDLPRNQLLLGFADAVCVPAIQWIDQHVLTPLYESVLPRRKVAHTRQPKP